MPRIWIGYLFMLATIVLYAGIGVLSRTSNVSEYYVAGRRVPAMFNGMATAADWIWIVDHNAPVGPEKALLVIGVRRSLLLQKKGVLTRASPATHSGKRHVSGGWKMSHFGGQS